jgi:glyoxylase-like metal-dependent hydrolase (beta-lactamase superfamily II)
MRAQALGPDLIVFVSRIWQTACTAVRSGEEGFLIDSPVYPDELEALPEVLERAGFPVSGLLVTHADWDHLLARLAFPGAAIGCGEPTAHRLRREPGSAQRELRRFDEEHYIDGRAPLSLSAFQSLPVPGRLSLGPEHEIELHIAEGHTADGTAYLLPWLSVLVCGDYLSPVEIPTIEEGGTIDAYAATLERLGRMLGRVKTVVVGHGGVIARDQAQWILEQDRAYLEGLRHRGADASLPTGRRTPAQQRRHRDNADRVRRA